MSQDDFDQMMAELRKLDEQIRKLEQEIQQLKEALTAEKFLFVDYNKL